MIVSSVSIIRVAPMGITAITLMVSQSVFVSNVLYLKPLFLRGFFWKEKAKFSLFSFFSSFKTPFSFLFSFIFFSPNKRKESLVFSFCTRSDSAIAIEDFKTSEEGYRLGMLWLYNWAKELSEAFIELKNSINDKDLPIGIKKEELENV